MPHKDAIAIEPPKKVRARERKNRRCKSILFEANDLLVQVIKALYDWAAPTDTSMYMSFSAGDFLHVLSRENDRDWYEACNPLRNERGLVPVKYFENVGKTVRDSGDSSSKSITGATHDSGYAEGATPPAQITSAPRMSTNSAQQAMMAAHGHRSTKSVNKGAGGVYGIVSFDFRAERPDELDAKEGEAIIVIAQSNPEWFVAKPITRLGGPGLIPVSFIEIRDMTTGQVADDPVAAVAKAGIPRVEEWKKMAAEYKNTSIPLGTVSSSQQVQQGAERMSLNQSQQNGYGHGRQPSSSYHQQQQQQPPPQQMLHAPVRASVPRFVFSEDKFHFIVECRMSNGAHWDLSRIYEDFYELQINLKKAFPGEAGDVPGKPRILPYMPGPVQYVTDSISEGRRESLDEYLRDLLRLPQYITCSSLVRAFFAPRDGDYEVDPNAVDLNEHAKPIESNSRHSQTSHNSYNLGQFPQPNTAAMRQPPPNNAPQHQYSYSRSSNSNTPVYENQHQRGQPSQSNSNFMQMQQQQPPPQQQLQHPSQQQSQQSLPEPPLAVIPTMSRQTTSTTMASDSTAAATHEPVKVKAWFDRNTCVVIRMKSKGEFTFDDLYHKVIERRRLEFRGQPSSQNDPSLGETGGGNDNKDLEIEYRHNITGEYYPFENDADLNKALEGTSKITLAVRTADS